MNSIYFHIELDEDRDEMFCQNKLSFFNIRLKSHQNRAFRSTVMGKQYLILFINFTTPILEVYKCEFFLLSSPSSMHLPITSSKLRWELLIPSSSKFSLLFVVGLQRFFKLPSVGVVFVFQCGFISSCWSILVLYVSTS